MTKTNKTALIDASKIIIEACVEAGGDVYAGYPITPANLFYSYAKQRFPLFLAAPDEITTSQWMAGFSATGKMPVTATSFPGFALMLETLNMAYMMELPYLIILSQRLGPSTGSATTGAQGDLMLLRGCISGGYPLPVFCPSDFKDCWSLSYQSILAAISLRTPVILLTSKEMVMTSKSFDLSQLPPITPVKWKPHQVHSGHLKGDESQRVKGLNDDVYKSYLADQDLVPPFLPVGNDAAQVRLNASTHDNSGLIRKDTPESMANTHRLKDKIEKGISKFIFYDLDDETDSDTLIVTYGISSDAARDAVKILRSERKKISMLIIKTLLPVSPVILEILKRFNKLIFVEENISGLLQEILYGTKNNFIRLYDDHAWIRSVNKIGSMITPSEIIKEIKK